MFTYAVASDPAVAGYAMVSDRFLAVLSADADDAAALRLWRTLAAAASGGDHADTSLSSVLAAMAADGIAALPDFALVELVDAPTRAVALAVRGGAQIVLAGGDVRTGDGSGAWSTSVAQEVTGLTLQLGPSRSLFGQLPLGRGVVRADRLDWGAGGDAAAVTPDVAAAPASRASRRAAAPASASGLSDPPLGTIRRERLPAHRDVPDLLDAADDRTELSRVHRRPSARPVLRMTPDRVLELDLPVVFGRSPRPASHPGARLVALPSPHREISGSHLEVRLEGESLIARDLDSTNGTIVREPDGSMQLLRHGATARLARGASLDLGDGMIAIFDVADGAVS